MTKRFLVALLASMSGFGCPSFAQSNGAEGVAVPNVQRESYVLGVGDKLAVSVLGRSDYSVQVEIQSDGTIQLPYINSIPAAGRTQLALRDQIRQALIAGQFFADPAVNLSVVSFSSRTVTVLGQVKGAGIVPIDRAYRLSEVIARAGGVADPSIDAITLTRASGETMELSLREIATSGPAGDPLVADGDKIFVAPPRTYYLSGQVSSPGTYPLDKGMTLQMAIPRGGGISPLGSEKRAKIIRNGQELKGIKPTELILPGDIIVVPERFF